MNNFIHTIESSNLQKDVEIAVYGHFGSTLILFSTDEDDAFENEQNGIIEALQPFIKNGKIRVYSVPTINKEMWENEAASPQERSKRHFEYNNFIIEELVPFIYDTCGTVVPLITAGASKGAYHALNTYLRRPDLILGSVAMSGIYDIFHYTRGYFDDNCYFNSPIHYLPNLNDNYWLTFLKSRHHVYILSGKGSGEDPNQSYNLSNILVQKGIPHHLDIWSDEWSHCVDTWKAMLRQVVKVI